VNFDGVSGADAFAALSFVALGFIRHFAFAACLINKQNLLRANLHAFPAADAEIFIYQHNLVHSGIYNLASTGNKSKVANHKAKIYIVSHRQWGRSFGQFTFFPCFSAGKV
jgi:hypothetical protein